MVLIRLREKNVRGSMSFIRVICKIGKQKQGSFSGAPALLCVGNRIMNYHPFCPTVKLNSDVLSSVWSQVTVQTCAAHVAPVLLFATTRLLGWRRLRLVESSWERLVAAGREAAGQPGRHRADRISEEGRKQLLWGTGRDSSLATLRVSKVQ